MKNICVPVTRFGLPLENFSEKRFQKPNGDLAAMSFEWSRVLRRIRQVFQYNIKYARHSHVLWTESPQQVQIRVQVSMLRHFAQQSAENLFVQKRALPAEPLSYLCHPFPLALFDENPQCLHYRFRPLAAQKQLHFQVLVGPFAREHSQGPFIERQTLRALLRTITPRRCGGRAHLLLCQFQKPGEPAGLEFEDGVAQELKNR